MPRITLRPLAVEDLSEIWDYIALSEYCTLPATSMINLTSRNNQEVMKEHLIGYARVSTGGQELHSQIDALKKAGVPEKLIFIDKSSKAKSERPGLDSCMNELKAEDTLIIWRLDRLGRSLKHLIETVEELTERGVGFRSINDGDIDTTTASGEMVVNIFATLAQFERRLIQECMQAGLKAARAR